MEERCKGGASESEEASRRPSTGVSRRAQVGCSEAVRRSVGWTAEGKVGAAPGEAVGRQGHQGRASCKGQGVSRSPLGGGAGTGRQGQRGTGTQWGQEKQGSPAGVRRGKGEGQSRGLSTAQAGGTALALSWRAARGRRV